MNRNFKATVIKIRTKRGCLLTPLVLFLLMFSLSVMSSSLEFIDCSMPGVPVLHYLLEFNTRTHVYRSQMLSNQPPVSLNTILAKCTVIENEQRQCKYVTRGYKILYFQIINMCLENSTTATKVKVAGY